MIIELNLPPDLTAQLQKMAESNHVSVDRLIESVLNDYVSDSLLKEDDGGGQIHETDEFLDSIITGDAEIEAGNFYTQDDINQMLVTMLAEHLEARKTTHRE